MSEQGAEQTQSVVQRQLVVFRLLDETYGVDIHQVREIIRVPEITRVPRAPEFVEGVINLRGNVIPVLDLRKRFKLQIGTADDEQRIIVVEMENQTIGMIVDAVSEVLGVAETSIDDPSPYIVSVNTHYIEGIVKLEEELIILLRLDQVLSDGEKERLERIGELDGGV